MLCENNKIFAFRADWSCWEDINTSFNKIPYDGRCVESYMGNNLSRGQRKTPGGGVI